MCHRVECALETAEMSVAPPERTARLGTDSVLPPKPTITSSWVRVNREPAHSDLGGENSDEGDGNLNKAEGKGKGVDRGGDDSEIEDEVGDDSDEYDGEGVSEIEDADLFEDRDAVMPLRFGPPKGVKGQSGSGHVKSVARQDQDATDATLASSIDNNILFFVTVYLFLFF